MNTDTRTPQEIIAAYQREIRRAQEKIDSYLRCGNDASFYVHHRDVLKARLAAYRAAQAR